MTQRNVQCNGSPHTQSQEGNVGKLERVGNRNDVISHIVEQISRRGRRAGTGISMVERNHPKPVREQGLHQCRTPPNRRGICISYQHDSRRADGTIGVHLQ